MNYFWHLWVNIKIALKCFVLVFFHLAHGLIPVELTDHKRWGIGK